MKIKGARSFIKQVTFEGNHPSTGIVSTGSWFFLQALIARSYSTPPENILSFKITVDGLEIFWKEFLPHG